MTTIFNRATVHAPSRAGRHVVLAFCFLASAVIVSVTSGQERSPASRDASTVQEFVGETTFLILKIQADKIELPELDETLESLPPAGQTASRQMLQRMRAVLGQLQASVKDRPVYATFGMPTSGTRLPIFIFIKDMSGAESNQFQEILEFDGLSSWSHGDYFVMSPTGDIDVARSLVSAGDSSRQAAIEEAFQSIESYPIQVLALPPAHVWRTIDELMPELPPQVGGGPSRVLTEGVRWAAVGIDPQQLQAHLVIRSSSENAARNLADRLPNMLRSLYASAPQIHEQIPQDIAQAMLGLLTPEVTGDRITINIDGQREFSANLRVIAAITRRIEYATRRQTNSQRFMEILRAMHNYHGAFLSFPPADRFRSADGKHLLSWRVHLLPFLGQRELYEQFHLDEPWDSPHNKQLVANMPDIYKSHSLRLQPDADTPVGHTTFQAPVGEDTILGGAEATTFGKIHDGSSNTIVLVEVKSERAVPWTAPQDYAFDPNSPASGLLIGDDDTWIAGMADGSVQHLHAEMTDENVLHLFRMSDGHSIDYDAR